MQMLLDGGASRTAADVDERTPRDVVCLHEDAHCSPDVKRMLESLLSPDASATEPILPPEHSAPESLASVDASDLTEFDVESAMCSEAEPTLSPEPSIPGYLVFMPVSAYESLTSVDEYDLEENDLVEYDLVEFDIF